MNKTEIKAYLGVLKSVSKTSRLDTLKGIAVSDCHLEATNLDVHVRLKHELEAENGIYDVQALDLISMGFGENIAPYKKQPLTDWVERKEQEWNGEIKLSKGVEHLGKTLVDFIVFASGFVSNDNLRPALTAVWVWGGEIVATDGYRAFASGEYEELKDASISLRGDLLKQFKKVAKYGNWVLRYNDQMVELENGHISIAAPLCAGTPPKIRQLIDTSRSFTHVVKLPYKALKQIIDKNNNRLALREDGAMELNQRELPFRAVVLNEPYEYKEGATRAIICGLKGNETRMDTELLKAFTPNKKGEIALHVNMNDNTSEHRYVYGVDF